MIDRLTDGGSSGGSTSGLLVDFKLIGRLITVGGGGLLIYCAAHGGMIDWLID